MSDYVNKVKKDNTTYDINDARIASPANADVGKVLKVADDLSFEYGEAGGGSGESAEGYLSVDLTSKGQSATVQDFYDAIGYTSGDLKSYIFVKVKLPYGPGNVYTAFGFIELSNDSKYLYVYDASNKKIKKGVFNGSSGLFYNVISNSDNYLCLFTRDSSINNQKVYVAKLVDNVPTFVEDVPLPSFPQDAYGAKTYVLKVVDGTLTWVAE